MKKIDLTAYVNTDNSNKGISKEWALCRYFGIERDTHDHQKYNEASDIELPDGTNISVKTSGFTLMSGTLCVGCKTFEGIWRRYYKNCHSNTWAYITNEWQCYIMNKKEFSKFVHRYASLARESSKGHHLPKIRAKKETFGQRVWLEIMAA